MIRKSFVIVFVLIINMVMVSCSIMEEPLKKTDEGNENIFMGSNMDDILDTGPIKGGILKLFSTAPDTLNPIITKNSFIKDYSCFVYESLVVLDKSQRPVPLLAESWTVSDDGLEWTFYLRKDVYWHDNIPFSAEDVEFTMNMILDTSIDSIYKPNIQKISTFSAVDFNTFRITLNSPNSFTAEQMTFPIIPKHYFLGEDILSTDKNFKPVGTGPFQFTEYKENEYIKMKNNEKWWKGKTVNDSELTLPYIIEVDIRIFDKNYSVANAFQSKDVDIITVDREGWTRYSGRSDVTIKRYPGNKFEFISFNLSNRILQEKEVRKAIAYTVDKLQIISKVMHGEAFVSDIPVIPDTWLNDTKILTYEVNREKARQILTDAGWADNNGIMYKKINGVSTPLRLEMLVNDDNDTRLEVAEEIKNQLSEIGAQINIKPLKWDDELKSINTGKYDMAFLGLAVSSIPDVSFLYSSAQIGTGFNIAGYKSEAVDSYLNIILSEMDNTRKKAMFLNMMQIIYDDMPYLGLYFYKDAVIYNKKIRGEFNPNNWSKYDDFTRWYIPPV